MHVREMGSKQDPLFTLDSSLCQVQPQCHRVYGLFLPPGRMVWKAATANQVRKFENTMDCIKNVNLNAYDYLKEVVDQKWTLVHDHGH